jgi:hypothetical protein
VGVNTDQHLQPDEPIRERETSAPCDPCETDTTHLDLLWSFGAATRECLECGEITELEDDR